MIFEVGDRVLVRRWGQLVPATVRMVSGNSGNVLIIRLDSGRLTFCHAISATPMHWPGEAEAHDAPETPPQDPHRPISG